MSDEQNPHEMTAPESTVPTTKMLRYEIDWHYTPTGFFPTTISERVLDCDLTIDQGAVSARIAAEVYESSPDLKRQLQGWLEARFKVQQFKTAKTYELDSGSLTEYRHDGTRILNLSVCVSSKVTVTADIMISDSTGNVVFDSAAERAKEKLAHENNKNVLLQLDSQLEGLIQGYYEKNVQPEEPLVASLLASYRAACNDPVDELVYLYEIRDALSKRFGGEGPTRQALSVTKNEWSAFGQLANDEPVRQGRHRGKFSGELREATEEELVKARLFAKKLLLNFLHHVTTPKPASSEKSRIV